MENAVNFLMSTEGLLSAVATLIGVIVGVQKLVLPIIRSKPKACLTLSGVTVEAPPPHSEAGELTFEIMNSGVGTAVLTGLFLKVLDKGVVVEPKMIELAAPLPEYNYKVVLDPSILEYNIRKKKFGSEVAHSFKEGEAEAFKIELLSKEPQWYELQILAKWYDLKSSKIQQQEESSNVKIIFQPDVRDLINSNID
ncbi:MAG: hypothetical protein GY787_08020 [Alteromonadales bacterium]|nr:hypothetical protein [Alteromonadales bacterium]